MLYEVLLYTRYQGYTISSTAGGFAAEYIPYVQDAVQGTGTTADYSTWSSCRATCEASKQQNTEIRPDERRSKPAAVAR